MTRNPHTQNTISRFLAVGLLAGLAGVAQGQTDVGPGGTVIDHGAGSKQITLRLKNTTGFEASDITLVIHDGWPTPDIETVDVEGHEGRVDDNEDGFLTDDEDDNSPKFGKSLAKTILVDSTIANNGIVEVDITLGHNTNAGTKITVKFSKGKVQEDGKIKHLDMAASADFGPDTLEFFLPVTPGAPQMVTTIIHDNQDWVYDIVLPVWPENPLIDIQLPDEFGDSLVFPGQDEWIVHLVPPLPPQQPMDLFFETEFSILDPLNSFEQPIFIFVGRPLCRVDLNEDGQVNTLDFLEFLNLFNQHDPIADWNNDGVVNTLDFLAFLNEWNEGCG